MGYITKVQVIQRGKKNRQYYFICPAPLAQALEIEKGESIEWVVEDKQRLTIRRLSTKKIKDGRSSNGQKAAGEPVGERGRTGKARKG
jgi:bifunctional DNA-binding transcriptional regulator/antitoxin component of YhaV-PrlF toxin-antitoxin module